MNWWARVIGRVRRWGRSSAGSRRQESPDGQSTASAPPAAAPPKAPGARSMTRALAGGGRMGSRATPTGRLTRDEGASLLGGNGFVSIVAPPSWETDWRLFDLDRATLSNIEPHKLIEALADLSPEVSRALWDFLRQCNPGWECAVLRPSSDEPDPAGQAAINAFLAQIGELYGSTEVVFGRLFASAFLRGSMLAELVLDGTGQAAVDLAIPDPAIARFRRVADPVRGTILQLGQWQSGRWVAFDRPTIRYVPIDPFPGSPYGRPLAAPAVFVTLFSLGMLHDLRRVVAQQGYPRIDLKIVMEKLAGSMPAAVANNPTEWRAWVEGLVTEVETAYAALEPDDAYIHTDVIEVGRPVGAVDSSSLGAIDGLLKALERMAVRALKTAPFMMAVQESTTETQANRQWEAHLQSIKAIQHYAESILERLLVLVLQAQGLQGTVRFRFAENRAAEMLRDAQTEQLRIANASAKYAAGWISQDEASQEVTGHEADQEEPRAVAAASAAPDAAGAEPEPGANRSNGHSDQTSDLLAAVSLGRVA